MQFLFKPLYKLNMRRQLLQKCDEWFPEKNEIDPCMCNVFMVQVCICSIIHKHRLNHDNRTPLNVYKSNAALTELEANSMTNIGPFLHLTLIFLSLLHFSNDFQTNTFPIKVLENTKYYVVHIYSCYCCCRYCCCTDCYYYQTNSND